MTGVSIAEGAGPGIIPGVAIFPSGDNSGVTDLANVENALANEQFVWAAPGVFNVNGGMTGVQTDQTFVGSGLHTTSFAYKGTVGVPAMLDVGPSAVVQNTTIGGFQLFGNAYCGHGLRYRSAISVLRDVISQNMIGDASHGTGVLADAFHLDPATLATSINEINWENFYAIKPTNYGFFHDNVNDSNFYSYTGNGGGTSTLGGNQGLYASAGADNRWYGAHCYLWTNGGAHDSGTSHSYLAGEMESNGTADFIFDASHHAVVTQMAFYDHANSTPPTQHILVENSSGHLDVGDCDYRLDTYTVPNFQTTQTGSSAWFHDNRNYNPVGFLASQPTYVAGTALQNPNPGPSRVFVAGTTAVAIGGTPTGLVSGTFVLGYNETITPSGAGGSWTWFGL